MEVQTSALMVMLDCLLDTRIGVLFSFGEDKMSDVLNGNYYTRQEDKFTGIDPELFKQRYQTRNKETLKNTGVTKIITLLQEFVFKTLNQSLVTPHHMLPKIVLNTYPYDLSETEKETFVKVLMHYTKQKCQIEVIHKAPIELTPTFVKRHFSVMIMYHYVEWLEIHSQSEAFKTVMCPEVTLIAPALFFNGTPKTDELQVLERQRMSPFKAIEMIASPFIGLRLMPIEDFSFVVNLKQSQETA